MGLGSTTIHYDPKTHKYPQYAHVTLISFLLCRDFNYVVQCHWIGLLEWKVRGKGLDQVSDRMEVQRIQGPGLHVLNYQNNKSSSSSVLS